MRPKAAPKAALLLSWLLGPWLDELCDACSNRGGSSNASFAASALIDALRSFAGSGPCACAVTKRALNTTISPTAAALANQALAITVPPCQECGKGAKDG